MNGNMIVNVTSLINLTNKQKFDQIEMETKIYKKTKIRGLKSWLLKYVDQNFNFFKIGGSKLH
jgi:hypothetical protein